MRGSNIYHICNSSPVILFRQVEDFLIAISRLAVCSYVSIVEVFAFSIMSTHFHFIIRGERKRVDEFIRLYRRSVVVAHNTTYNARVRLPITCNLLEGEDSVISAMNYVLKNPIRHGIAQTAFSYPYSSVSCYFKEHFSRADYFPRERISVATKSPYDLTTRDYKRLFSNYDVPQTFRILSDRMVDPQSFVAIKRVETIYSSAKNFSYHMNRPIKDDVRMFGDNTKLINEHLSKSLLVGQISDLKACEIMDDYIAPRKYTEITKEETAILWRYLKPKGVSYTQFQRMVNINNFK